MLDGYLRQKSVVSRSLYRPPENSCDSHCHIFGNEEEFPFDKDRSYSPPEASLSEYRRVLDAIGFSRTVVVQPSVYGFDNSCTIGAVARFGLDRARAIVQIHPDASQAHLRELHAVGARGVRFITLSKGGAALDEIQRIAAKIAPLGWHLQMYLPPATWRELTPVLSDLPVDIVIDHMGHVMADTALDGPDARTILSLLENPRFWIKLCGYRVSSAGYPYADVAPWARRLAEAAPDRCVWGTDWPHPNLRDHMPDDGELLDLFAGWVTGEKAREAILVKNPEKLYRFTSEGHEY